MGETAGAARTLGGISKLLYGLAIGTWFIGGPWPATIMLFILGVSFSGLSAARWAQMKAEAADAQSALPSGTTEAVDDSRIAEPSSSSSTESSQSEMNGFDGSWKTDWGDIVLRQQDSFVEGKFAGAKLEGLSMHGKLFFEWEKPEDGMAGKGVLQVRGDEIAGSWGHGGSIEDGGPIAGSRIAVSEPSQPQPPLTTPPPLTEELIAAFAEMDIDHDGFITREELSASMVRAGHSLTDEQISKIMSKADVTKDDRIDLLEFSRYGDRESLLRLVSTPAPDEKNAIEQRAAEIQAEAEAKIEQARQQAQAKADEASELARKRIEQAEESISDALRETAAYKEARQRVGTAIDDAEETAAGAIEAVAQQAEEVIDDKAADVTQAVVEAVEQAEQVMVESAEANLEQLTSILTRLDSALMSSERASIITESSLESMRLAMKVERIDSTIGYGIDDSLRGGKTIIGSIDGIEHLVAIRLPKDMNDVAISLRAGQDFEQNVRLADFNSIRKMLQFDLT